MLLQSLQGVRTMRTKQIIKKIAQLEKEMERTDLTPKERSAIREKLHTLNKRLDKQQGK